jgi:putative membrane protein
MTTRVFMILNAATSAVALAFLFWLLYLRHGAGDANTLAFLPAVNAGLNATTSAFLIRGWFAIKAGKRDLHAFCQKTAFVFSSAFLVSYIIYHSVHGDSHYPGHGMLRGIYLFILITHILLSMAALPMVLATFFFALSGRFGTHRKLARLTFPIWLYVSLTGVLVFAFLKAAGV